MLVTAFIVARASVSLLASDRILVILLPLLPLLLLTLLVVSVLQKASMSIGRTCSR